MFCHNCGNKLPKGEAGLVGFSDRCNSPEILATAQKNRKSSIGCMWILVFVPLIGFPIAGLLMDDFPFGESLVIGVGIALVMLVVNLLALRKTKQPMWYRAPEPSAYARTERTSTGCF